MEHDRGTFKVNCWSQGAIAGDFRNIANFSPRLTTPRRTILCRKIRHSFNIAQLMVFLPRKHTVSLFRK
jgi:hypothetical protein